METNAGTSEPSIEERKTIEINNLRDERNAALSEVRLLKTLLEAAQLSSNSCKNNNSACISMTGLTWKVFVTLSSYLQQYVPERTRNTELPLQEKLFLSLVHLRQNINFTLLAHIKGISESCLIKYFWFIIDLMHAKLRRMVCFQDRGNAYKTIPTNMKAKYPRLTCIIDCFEVFIESPKMLLAKQQCYSNYKKHSTIKVFISCTPNGAVNYVSPCWGGRTSDVKIVRACGFIKSPFHQPGDQILADRGFRLKDDFASNCNAELIIPAFTRGKSQLSGKEVELSRSISNVRIHIERVIGLLKRRYTILKGVIPIRAVQSPKCEANCETDATCDKVVVVCAALINLGGGIVGQTAKK